MTLGVTDGVTDGVTPGVNDLAGKRVFVSGGAGVIGRELVARLDELGARVLVGDLQPRPASFPPSIEYRRGDLNHITREELRACAPQVFFHLAASFERSIETSGFWDEGYRNNVALSHHLIDRMLGIESLERVVFASSYLVYDPALYTFDAPPPQPTRLREDAPIRPRNLCGSAKHHHELELEFLCGCGQYGFSAVSARIYRSYGLGSRDVISRWVRSLIAGETLEVFGEQGCFDYVFARDVARGLLALATSEATGVTNLATGRPRRVSEVLEILKRHFPRMQTRTVPCEIACESAAADVGRLREQTGFVPETSLEQGIAEIVAFERAQSRACPSERPAPAPPARDLLITSISRKIPLIDCARRALLRFDPGARVHGADANPDALGRYFVDVFWVSPPFERDGGAALIEHCRRNGIRFVIPTRDGELAFFADRRDLFSTAGIEVLVSDSQTVADCGDKLRFARLLEAHGLPAIPTSESLDDFADFPSLVVKDRFGSGSRDLHCDVGPEEAADLAKQMASPIFQPFLSGREYSIDLYRDRHGKVHGTVCRTRDTVVGGESQVTTVVETPVLEALCGEVAGVLDYRGHATLQAIELPNGEFRILECNARFGGASTLSERAGLESFYWFFLEASGRDLAHEPFERPRERLRLVRYATDSFLTAPSSVW